MNQVAHEKENKETSESRIMGGTNGPQGVDKAPGEEEAQSTDNSTELSQKGKKVDGDPSLETDKPIKSID